MRYWDNSASITMPLQGAFHDFIRKKDSSGSKLVNRFRQDHKSSISSLFKNPKGAFDSHIILDSNFAAERFVNEYKIGLYFQRQ